jgi:hypothetical protein
VSRPSLLSIGPRLLARRQQRRLALARLRSEGTRNLQLLGLASRGFVAVKGIDFQYSPVPRLARACAFDGGARKFRRNFERAVAAWQAALGPSQDVSSSPPYIGDFYFST